MDETRPADVEWASIPISAIEHYAYLAPEDELRRSWPVASALPGR